MKNKALKTNIGTVDFSTIELMGSMELYVDIADLPEDLKEEVKKAIEKSKVEYIKHWSEIFDECKQVYNEKWGKSGVKISPQLYIYLPESGKIEYELSVYFEDLENSNLADSARLKIDLSEYESKLKKLIITTLIDKFF